MIREAFWARTGFPVAAFRAGHATASAALQRLNRFQASNRFYAANRELGRALRTEFRAADRVVSLSPSCRGGGGDGLEGGRLGLDADRGWRGRRPGPPPRKVAPGSRSPAGRREPARDSGPSVPPVGLRSPGEAGQAATRARFHDACAARRAAMADAPSAPSDLRHPNPPSPVNLASGRSPGSSPRRSRFPRRGARATAVAATPRPPPVTFVRPCRAPRPRESPVERLDSGGGRYRPVAGRPKNTGEGAAHVDGDGRKRVG